MILLNVLEHPFTRRHLRTTEVRQHYPGASVAAYLPEDIELARWLVLHNTRRCTDLAQVVRDGDAITLCPLPGDPSFTFWGLKGFEAFLALFAVNAAIGIVLSYLLAPGLPKDEGDEESAVYTLRGVRNNRGEGLPIPFYVGKLRAGGQFIVEFTEVTGLPPTTLYKFIICFGRGPAESIGQYTEDTPDDTPLSSDDPENPLPDDMLIEGNAAENFRSVKLWLRMGDPAQTPIPGFEKVATEHAVGQSLLQQESDNQLPFWIVSGIADPYNPSPADDPVWDEYGVAYDMTGDADEVSFMLFWPNGLYYVSSGGDIKPAVVKLLRRIIELDDLGNPITTGGPDGDGYLRFGLVDQFYAECTNPFAQEVRQVLYDPQTSTPGTPGDGLECDGTGGYAQADHTALTIPDKPANGDEFCAFTMEGWYRTGADPTADDGAIIAELWDDVNDYGISVRLAYKTYVGYVTHLVPVVRVGTAAGTEDYFEHFGTPFTKPTISLGDQPNTWIHIAVTYEPEVGTFGWQNRLTVYVNGVPIVVETMLSDVMWPYSTSIDLTLCSGASTGGAVGAAGTTASGRWDEWRLYTEALTSSEIKAIHFGGNGVYGSTKETLFAGYHFDADLTDFSGNINTLTAAGASAPAILSNGGKVPVEGSMVRKRGRFRVEVLRINPDSIHATTQDDVELSAVKTILDEAFSYPGMVLAGGEIEVDDQLQGTSPSITFVGKFRKHLVWDGINATNPAYRREWIGSPPNQALDMLLDTWQGAGFEIRPDDIDVQSFQDVADRCAEIVYDKRGDRQLSSDGDWLEATYDATVTDPVTGVARGAIAVNLASFDIPGHWAIGGYLRFTGWPAPASDDPDVNSDTSGEGYEIYAIDNGPVGKIVRVYWDRLAEGAAWGGSASLNSHLNPNTVADYDCYVEGGEPRFEGHGAFDTSRGFWDGLMTLLATCRAVPVKEGRKIRLRDDRARSAVDVVGQASIQPGSFEVDFEWGRTRPNHYDVQFMDAQRAYEQAQAALTSPDVQVQATFNGLRRESVGMEFCTSRRQALAQLAYMINHGRYIDRKGRFGLSIEGLGIEPSHVVRLSSDLVGWGVSGKMLNNGSTTTTAVQVDQAVTLTGGTVYYISIRNARTGTYEVAEIDVPTAGASYAAGDVIDLTDTLSFLPQEDDTYVLYSDGQEIDARIDRIVMDEGLRHEVEWTRYDARVHVDDWFEDIDASNFTSTPEMSAATMPGPTLSARLLESIQDDMGSRITKMVVSWVPDSDTIRTVARTIIHGASDDGAPVPIAEVIGRGAIAKIGVQGLSIGDTYTVWVQPVSHTGVRRAVSRCASASLVVMGYAPPPDAPSALSYERAGDLLTYTWTPVDRPDLAYSVRVGGWILGQEAGRVEGRVSSLGPTSFWASGGAEDPTVYLRAMTRAGRASGAVEVACDVDFDHDQLRELIDEAWEDYGNGFVWDTPTIPNCEFDNLERADGEWESPYAQFDTSTGAADLTGTYTTEANTELGLKPRRYYIEVFVDAEQVHPATWEDMEIAWGDPRVADWTWEGPADEREGTLRCTMTIEVRFKNADAWGDWEEYRPGIVWCQHAQARVTFTRPNTNFDIRMHRMHTRITNTPPTDGQRTDAQLWAESELNA